MLGDMIRMLREEFGLSQEQLASDLGVSRQSISKWESGAGLPDVNNAAQLAKRFGISVDDLLEVGTGKSEAEAARSTSKIIFDWSQKRPDYSLSFMGSGSVFTTWREIDGMHCLREVGDCESYGSYAIPTMKLSRINELRAIRTAAHEETKGILVEHNVYYANGFHAVRSFQYQAQLGDVIIATLLSLELPVGKHIQLYKASATEIRREPQEAWTIPWRKPSADTTTNNECLPLVSHSPEKQFPNLLSWDEHSFTVEGKQERVMGVAGVFEVDFGTVKHLCTRLIICANSLPERTWLHEFYINKDSRTMLKREFVLRDFRDSNQNVGAENDADSACSECVTLNDAVLQHVSDTVCASAFKR